MKPVAPQCNILSVLPTESKRALCERCEVNGLSFCGAFGKAHSDRLQEITTQARLGAKQTLFMEGDPAEYIFTLAAGMMEISRHKPSGRRQIIGFLGAADFLGLAHAGCYAYTATAISDVALCRFRRRSFEALMNEFPELEHGLFKAVSNELVESQNQSLMLGQKKAEERVASFLLWQLRKSGGDHAESIDLPMTRGQIADYLGITIETASRTFTALKEREFIGLTGSHKVNICNRDGLEMLAEG
jgi:CRP/FNR family transcriptional regulator